MTLKFKTIILFAFALLLLIASIIVFQDYRSTNQKLYQSVSLLDKIRLSVSIIEREIIKKTPDISTVNTTINALPEITSRLQEVFLLKEIPNQLFDLEISFIRIGRAIDSSLPGRTIERPLVEQIRDETDQIGAAVNDLQEMSRQRSNMLQSRSERMIKVLFAGVVAYILGVLYFLIREVIRPVIKLSEQIAEVREGKREDIDPSKRKDEIGILSEFARTTITNLKDKGNELAKSRREIQDHYERQVAFTKILELSVISDTIDSLINGVLRIVLSLDWLKIEERGGVFLVEKGEEPCLVLKNSVNFSPYLLKNCIRVPFGKCLCGKAALKREVIYAGNIDERHDITYDGMSPHGHYVVPIIFGDELIGVMTLYITPDKRRVDDEISFLRGVANILAEAIARIKLERSQRLVATAIDQAGEGVLITDRNGIIHYANSCMTTLSGYSLEELVDKNLNLMDIGEIDQENKERLRDALSSGGNWEGVIVNKRKDGTLYDEKMVITPIKSSKDETTNYVAIKRDISKEKRLESQLMQARKLEAVGTLAGGIAHDFNNILSIIFGNTQMAMDDIPKGNPTRENLNQVLIAASRAAELIRQILSFSRKSEQKLQIINPFVVIKETLKLLQPTIPSTVRIDSHLDEKCGNINGDPVQIHQILVNLTTNAVHAMDEKGDLNISLKPCVLTKDELLHRPDIVPGRYVRLSVSDNGKGMEPDMLDRIFDPFFTTKEVDEGTGMGLAVVHGIVMTHGGLIRVESSPGSGSIFHVFFPMVEESPSLKPLKPESELTGTERILFVDDEKTLVDVWSQVLRVQGYRMTTKFSSKDALETFRANPHDFDMIITDQTMPEMTGDELSQEILRIREDIPIILCTGYSSKISKEEALEVGISAFCMKPLERNSLLVTIRKLLDRA